MVTVGEEREPNVGEDKTLSNEVDELEHLLGSPAALHREVDVRVVGLHDATEENCHNACEQSREEANTTGNTKQQEVDQAWVEVACTNL